jgi:3-oxoacyl-[acyl-carrier-protein] synthase-3
MNSYLINVGTYLPEARINNLDRLEEFGVDEDFIVKKTGVVSVSRKGADETAVSMCLQAWEQLLAKEPSAVDSIDALIVVTQNPDNNIPHTSAVLHGLLDLPKSCLTFDISLGCSGFVAALATLDGLISAGTIKRGLIFTCDPYSVVVDEHDKGTALLFGDGAAVALVGDEGGFKIGAFDFGTNGKNGHYLKTVDGRLEMRGNAIFNFAALSVPKSIQAVLNTSSLSIEEIDLFALHQGSRYIVETIAKRMKLPVEKAPFVAAEYGNVVSSSIPFILEPYIDNHDVNNVVICGFGVGLSWTTSILTREQK